jgi:hypothetical protein
MCIHVDMYGITASLLNYTCTCMAYDFSHVFKIVPVHAKHFLSTRLISFYIHQLTLTHMYMNMYIVYMYMYICTCTYSTCVLLL